MDGPDTTSHHPPVRVLPHIKKLDDALGDFLVRVTCPYGASRHTEPEALARIAGRSVTLARLAARMRCSSCGKKVAEVVAVARPRPRGVHALPRNGNSMSREVNLPLRFTSYNLRPHDGGITSVPNHVRAPSVVAAMARPTRRAQVGAEPMTLL
jgi:hypothetical protein